MRIIDFHVHAFTDSLAPRAVGALAERSGQIPFYDGTLDGLEKIMETGGISLSVIQPVATKPSQCEGINRWASENGFREKITFFGAFHPDCENAGEIIAGIKAAGFKGVKLHPDYQSFFADEQRMMPIYEKILSEGLTVLLHSGVDVGLPSPVHCTPEKAAAICRTFPHGRFVFAHLGGFEMTDGFADEMEKAFPNGLPDGVYVDTSMGMNHYTEKQLGRILGLLTPDRLLFGSDGPWGNAAAEAKALAVRLKNLCGENAADVENKIFHANAEKLLSL